MTSRESKGKACTRCESGCCCGEECCLSVFCIGDTMGFYCDSCSTRCCCGSDCCMTQFCDISLAKRYDPGQMLANYHGIDNQWFPLLIKLYGQQLYNSLVPFYAKSMNTLPTQVQARSSTDYLNGLNQISAYNPQLGTSTILNLWQELQGRRSQQYQDPVSSSNFNYFGDPIGTSIKGMVCLKCTTGCCCDFGCCSGGYCSQTPSQGQGGNMQQQNFGNVQGKSADYFADYEPNNQGFYQQPYGN